MLSPRAQPYPARGDLMNLFKRFRSRATKRGPAAAIPILTYHAAHAHGYDYRTNDHLALEQDLEIIRKSSFRIAELGDVVAFVTGRGGEHLGEGRWVALTFDDGPDVDYFDFIHPDVPAGCLKSFFRILCEARHEDWFTPTAVSFVIADESARKDIDRACFAGRGHWRDLWWHDAASSLVLGIGNHSWDHAHPALHLVRTGDQRKGTFLGIDNQRDADIQIAAAQRLIWFRTAGLALPYFAYPYGEAPEYLTREYFPRFQERHGIEAAFVTGGDYARGGMNRWHIPRFVCGEHWQTPEELQRLLMGATRGVS